jgi:predicted dehydrogenase
MTSAPTNTAACRFAFLGTAGIARKNWRAIRCAGNARLVAVASRDAARAADFIRECQADCPLAFPPDPVGGYQEAIDRDDVDAVYLPLPTALRGDWAVRAAERGRHVLLEKPCGTSVADLARVIDACRAAGVQFMDGVMFQHSRRLDAVRACLDAGDAGDGLGEIRRIATQFSFRAPQEFLAGNIRMRSDLEPLGCLGDLGWYTIMFVLWAMEPRTPQAVTGRMLAASRAPGSPADVPMEFSGEILFRDAPSVSASFYCSFLAEHQQWVHVSGSRASLRIDDFVLPTYGCELGFTRSQPAFIADGCDFRMEGHDRRFTVAEYANGQPSAQEANLFRDFSELILSGRRDRRWPDRSLAVQRVMMAALESATNGGREQPLGD